MTQSLVIGIGATLLAFAAQGCSGYYDGSVTDLPDTGTGVTPLPPVDPPDAGTSIPVVDASDAMWEPEPPPPEDSGRTEPEPPPDAGEPKVEVDPEGTNLRLARTAQFDGYLTDGAGQALYMFAGDVSGSSDAACTGDCARAWPPFDVELPVVGAGIDPAHVSRIHRQDGVWQTTFKGRGLYYRATEAETRVVTGDGVDDRWFVARDYFAFLSTARTFAPAGGSGVGDVFLTDGLGRTLYVCLDDLPRTAAMEALSSCNTACTANHPTFAGAAPKAILPSVLNPADLLDMQRPDGQPQLTYRGWPLYYFKGDLTVGATAAHNDRAWRAFEPLKFGLSPSNAD